MAGDEHDADPSVKFGALLEPLLGQISPAEPQPVIPPTPAPRRLDERELMALIFSFLDHENPRVCEGIEFDRLEILSEPVPVDPQPQPQEADPPPSRSPATPKQPVPTLDLPEGWVGRGWTDDIATVPAALLDRPQLDAAQRQLLERAAKRVCGTLNLRRLHRDPALHHLQLFVHACRGKRVRVCRVITGKGVNSRDEPVIKRAVLEWCRGPGRAAVLGWAPQLDRHGEWGTLVLELRGQLVR